VRFRKSQKLPCYVLIYDQVDIIKKSLEFLTEYSGRLDIIVAENPSPNTPEISKFIRQLGNKKLLKRYYLFDENITNNAFRMMFKTKREVKTIKSSSYVITTDGDLVSNDKGWLDEEIDILKKYSEVFSCAVSLDMSNLPLASFPDAKNWIPADMSEQEDYYEAFTGSHLQMTRGAEFYTFLKWVEKNDAHLVDGEMHRYCYEVLHKKWARTKKAKAYHLTWDLYKDKDNTYTKAKDSKSFKEIWYHDKESLYTLVEF
jgi:hypothetical protein